MADGTFPVQWTGQQTIVTLPEHIHNSNANQIREQLLWIINRGATVLIADLTETVSCDYSGADALARVHHRGIANGTELRLVVTADAVRRVLSLNGLDRLVAVYPDLDGAVAAGAGCRELHRNQATLTADRVARGEDPLNAAIDSIFNVGLILQAAIDLPPNVTAQRITEALICLDDAIREVRHHMYSECRQGVRPDMAWKAPVGALERSARVRNRSQLLQRHVSQTARAVQSAAADTAALMERRADLLDQPGRIDYPTEIKRWRALADQAGQMADRWGREP